MKTIYVCNIFDQERRERYDVNSDSPAAFNKVLGVAKALNKNDCDCSIVSLSIGNSPFSFLEQNKVENQGVLFNYIGSISNKFIRSFYSSFSLLFFILKNKNKIKNIIFYNYLAEYYLSIFLCLVLNKKIIIDIEDGINNDLNIIKKIFRKFLLSSYITMSKGNILSVSESLLKAHNPSNGFVCYGLTEFNNDHRLKNLFDNDSDLKILFCGSLTRETGVPLLIKLCDLLGDNKNVSSKVVINIAGYGSMQSELISLAQRCSFVKFHGRVSDSRYKSLLKNSHVGLVFKDLNTSVGSTTFPSKIVEFSSNQLAIISTKVSDVPKIFNDGEIFLVDDENEILSALNKFLNDPTLVHALSSKAYKKAKMTFNDKVVGRKLKSKFLL